MMGVPLYPGENYWAPVWNNSFDREIVWVKISEGGCFDGNNNAFPPIQMDEKYDEAY